MVRSSPLLYSLPRQPKPRVNIFGEVRALLPAWLLSSWLP
jgi:hypothetical protein